MFQCNQREEHSITNTKVTTMFQEFVNLPLQNCHLKYTQIKEVVHASKIYFFSLNKPFISLICCTYILARNTTSWWQTLQIKMFSNFSFSFWMNE